MATARGVIPDDVHFRWSPKHHDLEVISKNSLPVYLYAPGENRPRPLNDFHFCVYFSHQFLFPSFLSLSPLLDSFNVSFFVFLFLGSPPYRLLPSNLRFPHLFSYSSFYFHASLSFFSIFFLLHSPLPPAKIFLSFPPHLLFSFLLFLLSFVFHTSSFVPFCSFLASSPGVFSPLPQLLTWGISC